MLYNVVNSRLLHPQVASRKLNISVYFLFVFVSIVCLLSSCGSDAMSWVAIKQEIREKFPEVTHLTVPQYLNTPTSSALIVDVRAPEEYAVSHMKDALNLTDPERIIQQAKAKGKDTIVVYCSVGYRSADTAHQIRQLGFTEVYNLEGSLFEWANTGHPVYNDTGETNVVHPYDDEWGVLLDKKYHPE